MQIEIPLFRSCTAPRDDVAAQAQRLQQLRQGKNNRIGGVSVRPLNAWPTHHPFSGEAQHRTRQRAGPMTMVVERTFSWLNQFRRLRVRYEKRADIHEAFLSLGCALICWYFLRVDWVAS